MNTMHILKMIIYDYWTKIFFFNILKLIMGACQCLNKELDVESEGNEIEAKINKLNSMSRSTAMS